MNKILIDHLRKIGKKGHKATLKKYGLKKMKEWGKLGGRPRSKKGITK